MSNTNSYLLYYRNMSAHYNLRTLSIIIQNNNIFFKLVSYHKHNLNNGIKYNFELHLLFLLSGFNIPFNTFQVISGWCLLVTDNHFIVLSIVYDIPPGHIIRATGQPVFALNYTLYVEHLTRELQLPI